MTHPNQHIIKDLSADRLREGSLRVIILLIVFFVTAIFVGCTVQPGKYCTGYHISQQFSGIGVVSDKVEEKLKNKARSFADIISNVYLGALSKISSDVLLKLISGDSLLVFTEVINTVIKPEGPLTEVFVEQVNIGSANDNVLKKEALDYYEYVRFVYKIHGKIDARLEVFLTGQYGGVKLGGIRLKPWKQCYEPLFSFDWVPVVRYNAASLVKAQVGFIQQSEKSQVLLPPSPKSQPIQETKE
ncbi:MAG: hypothetical protein HQK83_15430 [Fibrobacteria bacterium]|nr:hypothetical protein [Fibrobacteria bacterium]